VLAFVLLLPLVATSTAGMVKRLGGVNWRRLHRLAYVVGGLGTLHFLWLAKVGRIEPYVYAGVLLLLLGTRLWYAARRHLVRDTRQPAAWLRPLRPSDGRDT
jgi:sulfoxide reductase heme-binding subunit YedZ